MATRTSKVCDRCKREMKYTGWTAHLKSMFKTGRKIKITKYFNGNQDGYSYSDSCVELCAECTKDFERFLRGGE